MSDTRDRARQDWSLAEEVGGEDRLREMVRDFYARIFDDPMIGFLFEGHDLERIAERQVEYARARLGSEEVEYTGEPIRGAHEDLPILIGHFNRRHELLREVLEEYDVPDHVREAWIELDASLRELVVRTGGEAREAILEEQGSGGDESGSKGGGTER